MRSAIRRAIVCLLLGASMAAGTARAEQRGAQQGRAQEVEDAPVLAPGEVLNMLDAYAVMQAQNALQLADHQYGEFVVRLKRLQQTRRRHQQARLGLIQELRRLTNPQIAQLDEAAVRERLRRLRELDERAAAELKRAYDAIDEVLDLRQQARFRVFEENLERRKLDLLMRARRGAGARGR